MGRDLREDMLGTGMTYIIGEIATAEKNMEQCRVLMRLAKDPRDRAQYKRDFRKERNKALSLRRKIND